MKGWTRFITLVVVVLLAASFVPFVSGEGDSLHVIITVEDKDYKVGDTVTVEVLVYQKGVLTDVPENDTIEIKMSTHYNLNNEVDLGVVHPSTGKYTASYIVAQEDNHLYFFYEVEIGPDNEEIDHPANHGEAIHIDVYEFHNTVDVNFAGQEVITAHPGDIVTATIEVRYGTTLLDVNSFNSLVAIDPDGNETNLSASLPITQGIYETTYTIPDVSESGTYEIYANPDTGGHDEAQIFVNVLDVWYRQIDIIGTTATFEIGVADFDGLPVSGATVYVEGGNGDNIGTTNESGLVLLSLTGVSTSEHTRYVEGFAVSGVLNQSFSGSIFNEGAETPEHTGFDIIYNGVETLYDVSEPISRQYTAYYNAAPQASRQIYYYVTATSTNYGLTDAGPRHIDEPFAVATYGVATTDAGGKFTLDFTAPATQCELGFYFESGFTISDLSAWNDPYDHDDIMSYDEWPEGWGDYEGSYAYVIAGDMIDDDNVNVKASDFNPGEAAEVTVEMPGGYDNSIMTMWVIGEVDIESETVIEERTWQNWAPGGGYITLTKGVDGTYTGSYMVPTFIDTDSVFVYSGYNDGLTGFPHYNYDTGSLITGSLPLLWILIILILVIVAAFALIWYFKNS